MSIKKIKNNVSFIKTGLKTITLFALGALFFGKQVTTFKMSDISNINLNSFGIETAYSYGGGDGCSCSSCTDIPPDPNPVVPEPDADQDFYFY
jgi:hypothetical protein